MDIIIIAILVLGAAGTAFVKRHEIGEAISLRKVEAQRHANIMNKRQEYSDVPTMEVVECLVTEKFKKKGDVNLVPPLVISPSLSKF